MEIGELVGERLRIGVRGEVFGGYLGDRLSDVRRGGRAALAEVEAQVT
jgi:hypothetical protein